MQVRVLPGSLSRYSSKVERTPHKGDGDGSSPSTGTGNDINGSVAQRLERWSYKPSQRGFESLRSHKGSEDG